MPVCPCQRIWVGTSRQGYAQAFAWLASCLLLGLVGVPGGLAAGEHSLTRPLPRAPSSPVISLVTSLPPFPGGGFSGGHYLPPTHGSQHGAQPRAVSSLRLPGPLEKPLHYPERILKKHSLSNYGWKQNKPRGSGQSSCYGKASHKMCLCKNKIK